jgi:hypothetical protein
MFFTPSWKNASPTIRTMATTMERIRIRIEISLRFGPENPD